MARPRRIRFLRSAPAADYFCPRGAGRDRVPEVKLHLEELEAIKLSDLEAREQIDAARSMKVSRQTFGRVLQSGRRKVAEALGFGRSLKIAGGVNNLTKRSAKEH